MIFWLIASSFAQETTCNIQLELSSILIEENSDSYDYDPKSIQQHETFIVQRLLLESEEYDGQRFPVYDFDTLHLSMEASIETETEEGIEYGDIQSFSLKSSIDGKLKQQSVQDKDMAEVDPSSFVFSLTPGKHKLTATAKTVQGRSCSSSVYVHVHSDPKPQCFWRDVNDIYPEKQTEDEVRTIHPWSLWKWKIWFASTQKCDTMGTPLTFGCKSSIRNPTSCTVDPPSEMVCMS